jgi:hypothetical protein
MQNLHLTKGFLGASKGTYLDTALAVILELVPFFRAREDSSPMTLPIQQDKKTS